MNKTAIKNFAVWAREKLISDITYKTGMLGVTENGIADKLPQSTADLHFYDVGTKNYAEISGTEIKQREALVKAIKAREKSFKSYKEAFENVVEEVAYTWFNRLIAIRFMEVNNYLPSGVRVLSSENRAKNEPDFVTTPFDTDLELTPYEQDRVIQLKDENKLDELFRMLFIKQCNKLHDIFPELFEKTDDYTELLLTISFTDKDGIVYHLVHDIDEDDFNVEKEGQVEIIGWMYQYYNTEPKQAVFDGLKKNVKITKEKIPAATQLFTPDWIVRYMVENSLGRLWLESHPNDALKASWKYYLDEAEQTPEVAEKLRVMRSQSPVKSPEDIRLIDPCMGSGHILVYAFDVLMQIYESEGYNPRDAAKLILEKNIYGLDIDRRAYQLAYFSLMMKARQYNRRIFTDGVKPQVYHPAGFPDGEEYGSLVKVDKLEPMPELSKEQQMTLFDGSYDAKLNAWNFKRLLVQKYDVVVTNPPYMGGPGIGAKLSDFVKKNYPDSKSDLFAVFIEKCGELLKSTGYQAMITQHAWMFLSSYEKLRGKLMHRDIISMAHLGARAFEEIGGEVVQTTAFVLSKRNTTNFEATYVRLVDYNSQQAKEEAFLTGSDRHTAKKENFEKIPGCPIAYWVSDAIFSAFTTGINITRYVDTFQGIITGNNDKFLRKWYEVVLDKVALHKEKMSQVDLSKQYWLPYNKGGDYRKWYGNQEYVVYWKNGPDDKTRGKKGFSDFYLREYASWSYITSSTLASRYFPKGFLWDVSGSGIFDKSDMLYYLMSFIGSKVGIEMLKIINPTINYQVENIAQLPILLGSKERVDVLVEENIANARIDWDSFEIAWDFIKHPLLNGEMSIAAAFGKWEREATERFDTLKSNEEELNRIFIDIYGLQDELTPEVEDKDVTVHRIFELKEDIPELMKGSRYALTKEDVIKSLISYAVGCMFGRYSLDVEGLAYAGGDWDNGKYSTFIPDADNCIPITDEEYFEDDIVGLFCAWLKKVYGEDTLEENLDFIAKALGNKGNTSREVIRNYFLNDFMKDHIKIYRKRPIYWMFDSGKQNGFKALCYMHRWNADTTGNMRVEYLHRMQRVYDKEIERMQQTIDNSTNSREVSAAEKRKDKLTKQLKETKDYDTKIAHLALSRIDIDLDDGVKVNYEKVQTAPDGKKMQILAKI